MRKQALTLLLILVALPSIGSGQSAEPRYSITINTDQPTAKAGSELRVKIVEKNTTEKEQPFWVESNAAAHGEYLYFVEVQRVDGKPTSKSKYYRQVRDETGNFKGGVALNGGLINQKPGEAFTSSIDLNELYELQPGKYTIQVYLNDSIAHLTVKSNTITVTVTP